MVQYGEPELVPGLPPSYYQTSTRLEPTTAPSQDRHFCCTGQMKGMTGALETLSAAALPEDTRNSVERMEDSQGSSANGRCDVSLGAI